MPRDLGPPTKTQKEIHEYMIEYQDQHGAPPTMREIAKFLCAASVNAANDHLQLMKRKGMVRHYPGRARAWVPIRSIE